MDCRVRLAGRAKVDDIAALKRAKRELDRRLIDGAAEYVAALIHHLHGDRAADAITNVPCGHSRRPDCLGKQIAQAVAEALRLPFLQVSPIGRAPVSATRRSSPSCLRLSELPTLPRQ
jgi:hypothetical protein